MTTEQIDRATKLIGLQMLIVNAGRTPHLDKLLVAVDDQITALVEEIETEKAGRKNFGKDQ